MTKFLTRIVLAALFIATGTPFALVRAQQVTAPATRTASTPAPVGHEAPFGYPVAHKADRTVTVDQNTRYLNVVQLETITINGGGKSVTWTFDTLDTRSFPLSRVLPGFDNVTVYVSESPLYHN